MDKKYIKIKGQWKYLYRANSSDPWRSQTSSGGGSRVAATLRLRAYSPSEGALDFILSIPAACFINKQPQKSCS